MDKSLANSLSVVRDASLLFTSGDIEKQFKKTAAEINLEYGEEHYIIEGVVVLCVLNGAAQATTALTKYFKFPVDIQYVYGNKNSDEYEIIGDVDVEDRHVLIIDDILDQGTKIKKTIDFCNENKAKSVMSLVLCDKNIKDKSNRPEIDFSVISVPDVFVYGYGMDCYGYFRNLPNIYGIIKV